MTTYTLAEGDFHVLQGKTILIIGAATGIGRAAVEIALGEFSLMLCIAQSVCKNGTM